MANSKGSSSNRNRMYNGKNLLLPPKSPHPRSAIGPRDGNSHHQRTWSESFLIDEQPSWLDELLDGPETPVRRGGHRRSSSDSFAYIDTANVGSLNYIAQDDNKFENITLLSPWGSQDIDFYRDIRDSSFYPTDTNHSGKSMNKIWGAPLSLIAPPRGLPSPRDNGIGPNSDRNPSSSAERQDVESGPRDPKGSFDKDSFHVKSSASETDAKRSKQQYAQRSRVRKLRYIAELERNVQDLQAEGSEVSAELEFLNQQNLILSLENKALKKRLESLSQEQLIKYFEHEVLEREAGRLRSVKSRDLDQQFANLSLKTQGNECGSRFRL